MVRSANVSHFDTNRRQCPVASNIHIFEEGKVVFVATLGGQFSEIQALQEFERHPKRFRPAPKNLEQLVEAL